MLRETDLELAREGDRSASRNEDLTDGTKGERILRPGDIGEEQDAVALAKKLIGEAQEVPFRTPGGGVAAPNEPDGLQRRTRAGVGG